MLMHLLDDLFKEVDSKYRLVHIAAKRSKQINRGSRPLIETKSTKPTSIALEEILAKKVQYELPPQPAEGCQTSKIDEETRAAWFRHIPPEDLMVEQLASEEEKEEGEEFTLEAGAGEFRPELEEGGIVLVEGLEEFDPISEVSLEEEIPRVEIDEKEKGQE
jgi:DNA-directed RNA polymerase subunit omega